MARDPWLHSLTLDFASGSDPGSEALDLDLGMDPALALALTRTLILPMAINRALTLALARGL